MPDESVKIYGGASVIGEVIANIQRAKVKLELDYEAR